MLWKNGSWNDMKNFKNQICSTILNHTLNVTFRCDVNFVAICFPALLNFSLSLISFSSISPFEQFCFGFGLTCFLFIPSFIISFSSYTFLYVRSFRQFELSISIRTSIKQWYISNDKVDSKKKLINSRWKKRVFVHSGFVWLIFEAGNFWRSKISSMISNFSLPSDQEFQLLRKTSYV